ncbi:MAG: tetratricopeptide repeat protein [Pseudomonadota bacterium]
MHPLIHEGAGHYNAGRLDEAEACFRQVVDADPVPALMNLGVVCRITGRIAESADHLRRALALRPDLPAVNYQLGMTLLQKGEYAQGWVHYEARHSMLPRATAPLPEWRGEPLRGKRILIIAEQGLGDQVLWARFVPLLRAQAAEVGLAVARILVPLFDGLADRVFNAQSFEDMPYDVWASIGSVPRWLGAGPDDATAPYLSVAPAADAVSGAGLMLDGGDRNPNPARLPPSDIAARIRAVAPFADLSPQATGAADFGRTARLIAGLERVVSVDTSVAHVAGAMGKPCHVLLPRPARDWWANWDDDRTPWYPSVRTIRQRAPGDWEHVLGDLRAALATPAQLNES